MRAALARWISESDVLDHHVSFGLDLAPLELAHLRSRTDDYFFSLTGEFFDQLREPHAEGAEWARLGNALARFGLPTPLGAEGAAGGILRPEAALFAATAFYLGGYPASAYITLKSAGPPGVSEAHRACYELLTRRSAPESRLVQELLAALREGDIVAMENLLARTVEAHGVALLSGADEWVGARLLLRLTQRFHTSNVRAVLPDGQAAFWTPLVHSLIDRPSPAWEFFPSQIQAIKSGLLEGASTYSLQMPTGAGKTALTETLLYYHLQTQEGAAAVLLVPYRALASELRGTVVKRLNAMGIRARCAYGGSVPSGDEVQALADTRALIATPEALSGLLSADQGFFNRISLVVCDEGHLLDSEDRGIGLELLLARMKARKPIPPRFVFVSAIVPNIDEINAWLGGTPDTLVQSTYRPATAEFAVLRPVGSGVSTSVNLELHPQELPANRVTLTDFLRRTDFQWLNPATGRTNTYRFQSTRTQAVAAGRKALAMGTVVLFSANKRGRRGAVGLADELLRQLELPLRLPDPTDFANQQRLAPAVDYMRREFGGDWIGTRMLRAGGVLHHGDVPQECREVVEELARKHVVGLVICTTTLAEGVNLPIRTLVLYSVRRGLADGSTQSMLARDITNLVGRAGRAGATTKGLVIVANPEQWSLVEPAARDQPGERVRGALHDLMVRLHQSLALYDQELTNEGLEDTGELLAVVDGIDSVLVDLAAEEIGEGQFLELATNLAGETFAAQQVVGGHQDTLRAVFRARAKRVLEIRAAGRLGWIRSTGARARMMDPVVQSLRPLRATWDDIEDPTDQGLVDTLVAWAWERPELIAALEQTFPEERHPTCEAFAELVRLWLAGRSFHDLSTECDLSVDDVLSVHARVLAYTLPALVDPAVALLEKYLETEGLELATAVLELPEHLRFGVPTRPGRVLAASGVRHRRAFVELGLDPAIRDLPAAAATAILEESRTLLANTVAWEPKLGRLVMENTLQDLDAALR